MITDELREWANSDELRAGMSLRRARDHALAIADRIDAEHRAALEKVAAMVDEPDEKCEVYYDRFIARTVDEDAVTAALYDLEKRIERIERRFEELRHRVERIERLLSHKGGAE